MFLNIIPTWTFRSLKTFCTDIFLHQPTRKNGSFGEERRPKHRQDHWRLVKMLQQVHLPPGLQAFGVNLLQLGFLQQFRERRLLHCNWCVHSSGSSRRFRPSAPGLIQSPAPLEETCAASVVSVPEHRANLPQPLPHLRTNTPVLSVSPA